MRTDLPDTDRRTPVRPPVPAGLRPLVLAHVGVLAAGTTAVLLTTSALVRAVLLVALSGWAAAVVLRATSLLRPSWHAKPWAALAVAQVVSVVGWAVWVLLPALGHTAPAWTGDAAFVTSDLVCLAALLALGGLRRHRDRLAALDTAVLAVSCSVLVWVLVETSADDVGVSSVPALAVADPALNVLLVAFVLRLVLAGSSDLRTGLLLAWALTKGLADAVWAWDVLHGQAGPQLPVLATWLVSSGLLALAASVPPGVVRRTGRTTSASLGPTVVLLAVLPLPLLLVVRAVQGTTDGVVVVTVGSAVVTGLVVARALLDASNRSTRGAGPATLRLVAAFLVLALLPLAGLTAFAVQQSHAAMDDEVTDRMEVTAAVSAGYVGEELSSLQTLVASYADRRLLAAVIDPRTAEQRAELARQLRQLAGAHADITDARVLDLQGRTVDAHPSWGVTAADPSLVPVGVRGWVLDALPVLRSSLPPTARSRLAASGAVKGATEGFGKGPTGVRALAFVGRHLHRAGELGDRVSVRPSHVRAAYGDTSDPAGRVPVRTVLVLTTSTGSTIEVDEVEAAWAARRLSRSAGYERRGFFDLQERAAYAGIGTRAGAREASRELEEQLLLESFAAAQTVLRVACPFPGDPRAVLEALDRLSVLG